MEIAVDVLVASVQRAGPCSHEKGLGVGYKLYRSRRDVIHKKEY
jgi:hypothetical protein